MLSYNIMELADSIVRNYSDQSLKGYGDQERFLETGKKKANITAVFRKGKKQDPRTYGAGSLTSVPGRMMLQMISSDWG